MSATQDRNQKIAFVYSNLYHVYRKGKAAASGAVIKADDLQSNERVAVQTTIRPYRPIELLVKRMDAARAREPHPVENLRQNLKSLNDLHARLKFMLGELEDLMKDDSGRGK